MADPKAPTWLLGVPSSSTAGLTAKPSVALLGIEPTPYKWQARELEQVPFDGLQTPGWQPSDDAQTTGLAPTHAPAWQVSLCVQALPSLQAVPLATALGTQAPVPVSHEAVWHWSGGVQTTGVPATQAPAWQASPWVQALPSEHDVPLATGVCAQFACA